MRNKIPPYKAKTLQTGNYVYGFYIEKPDNSLDSQKLSYYICCNDSDGYHEYEVDSNTLCEFTGLFNYKNIPLYENDLIRNYMSSTIYKIQKECDTPGGCWFNTGYILQEVNTDDYITFEDTIPDIDYDDCICVDVINQN